MAAPTRMIATIPALILGALIATDLGCASSRPSQELVDARRTYRRATESSASVRAKDKLHLAKKALDTAEAEHEDDAGSLRGRHLAYLADRRARVAMAEAAILDAQDRIIKAERAQKEAEIALRRHREQQLERTRQLLDTDELSDEAAEARIRSEQSIREAERAMREAADDEDEPDRGQR